MSLESVKSLLESLVPSEEYMVEFREKFPNSLKSTNVKVFNIDGVPISCWDTWSERAVGIVAKNYLRVINKDTGEVETSVLQMVERVTHRLWSEFHTVCDNYLDKHNLQDEELVNSITCSRFSEVIERLCANQAMAFNSPVWFNLGVEDNPQCSACFIQSVEDSIVGLSDLQARQMLVYKSGSGSGSNLSNIRSSVESLSGGGLASGPVSFMKGLDAWGGAMKSGGTTRRAAALVTLDIDHPDIEEFIECKSKSEKAAHDLVNAGWSADFTDTYSAYNMVPFQNTNHSIMVTNDFMNAVINNQSRDWPLYDRNADVVKKVKIADLWNKICESAWLSGDPGLQFSDAINDANLCSNDGCINGSNPCGEFLFLDDTACNLASINLVKFVNDCGIFDHCMFRIACSITILAQDLIVDIAGYPTKLIEENSKRYRPLGLGFTNLHSALIKMGVEYHSETPSVITEAMTAHAILQSQRMAKCFGAFDSYSNNKIQVDTFLSRRGIQSSTSGIRNAQVTLVAPTGTISFMMDCDSTGIEPIPALSYTKKFVSGETKTIIPQIIKDVFGEDLSKLSRDDRLKCKTAFSEDPEFRITPKEHLQAMAHVQPYITGGISKTVNLPHHATIQDVSDIFIEAYKMGLKSITIYRDGCKALQPINVGNTRNQANVASEGRYKLANEIKAIRKKFVIGGNKCYAHIGFDQDNAIKEIFLTLAKYGNIINGFVGAFSEAVSLGLQYGVPLEVLCKHFKGVHFEPSGFTGDSEFPSVESFLDYIFRWLEKYVDAENAPIETTNILENRVCPNCSGMMQKTGTCSTCVDCGFSGGCG